MTPEMFPYLPVPLQWVIRIMAGISGAFLMLLTLVTMTDIFARSLGLFSIYGVIELSRGTLLLIACLGQPWVFASRGHIVVDLMTSGLPLPATRSLDAVGYFLAGLGLLVLAWYMSVGGWEMHMSGERSETLHLSPLLFRVPATVGLLVAALTAIIVAYKVRKLPTADA